MKFFAIAALFAAVEASAGTPQPSVSDTLISQLPERTTTTPTSSGVETGPNIELLTLTTKTAVSLSPTTGRVPNSALNPGSAEVPDFAREADCALDTTDVREPHSQTRPQDSPQITEQAGCAAQHPVNRYP